MNVIGIGMFIRSNRVLVVTLLVIFLFVPHVGHTNSSEAQSVMKEICTSIKDAIKNMSPTVMLGTVIAIILFMIIFKGFIVFVLISSMLFILFDNPKEIVDSVKEKINLIIDGIGSKKKVETSTSTSISAHNSTQT